MYRRFFYKSLSEPFYVNNILKTTAKTCQKRATNSKVAAINRTIVRHHPPPLAMYLLDNYYFSPLTMGTFIMSIKGRLLPIFNIINDLYKIKIIFDMILKQKDNSKGPLYSSVQCICWINNALEIPNILIKTWYIIRGKMDIPFLD